MSSSFSPFVLPLRAHPQDDAWRSALGRRPRGASGRDPGQLAAEGLAPAQLAEVEALDAPLAHAGLGAFIGSLFFGETRALDSGSAASGGGCDPPVSLRTW